MNYAKSVTDYISNSGKWQTAVTLLREIMTGTKMEETIKWGAPAYLVNRKLVAGLGAFKSYVGIWFHQGALLNDKHNKLINAQKDVTKALRQWRFESVEEIEQNAEWIKAYTEEAIANRKAGKEIKPERNKKLVVPPELKESLSNNPALLKAFQQFTLSKKREFTDYISSAKQDATKKKRLEKIIPMIKEGKGLHDKYRR